MSADEWVRFLGVNTVFVAVVLGLAVLWLRLLRRSSWYLRIRAAVLVAAGITAAYGVVTWVRQPAPPADTPAFVWPWGLLVSTGVGVAMVSLLALLIASILVGYRRVRSAR